MRCETDKPCDNCERNKPVARIAVVTSQGVLLDYRDLCPECLNDAVSSLDINLGSHFKEMKPERHIPTAET